MAGHSLCVENQRCDLDDGPISTNSINDDQADVDVRRELAVTRCGHIDLSRLAVAIGPSRRADIAAGLLLAAELVAELPSIPDGFGRLAWIALHDAAVAIHPDGEGEDLVMDLTGHPDDENTARDRPCEMCTGLPEDVITALGQRLRHVRTRNRTPVTTG